MTITLNKKQIETARNEFNNWQGKACIMFDCEDGEIWTDVYINENDFKNYHANTIVSLVIKSSLLARNFKVKYDEIVRSAQKVLEAYENGKDIFETANNLTFYN